MNLLVGMVSGLVGLAGLMLSSGILAAGYVWTGEFVAIAVACGMAVLGSTVGGRPASWRPAAAAACTGLVAWFMAGPNSDWDYKWAYALDNRNLLPNQENMLKGPPPWEWGSGTLMVIVLATLAGGGLAYWPKIQRRFKIYAILTYIVCSFLLSSMNMNPSLFLITAAPPAPNTYNFDGLLFLRTHALMQEGHGYYPAYYDAFMGWKDQDRTPGYWAHWRPPILFWLWNLVPGGSNGLLGAFWVMTCVVIVVAFFIMKRLVDPALALWSPVLLSAYFLYGAVTPWFPSQEWWGSGFIIFGLWGFMRGSPPVGSAFWALAACSREHYVFLLPVLALRASLGDRRDRVWAGLAWGVVFLVYGLHYGYVYYAGYYDPTNPGLAGWHSPENPSAASGPEFILRCLQFGSVYIGARTFLWLPILALGTAGALSAPDLALRVTLSALILVPPAAYLASGQDTRWYWGAVFVPQVLLCTPLLLRRIPGCQPPPGTGGGIGA